MNNDPTSKELSETILALFRYTLRLHCRHEVTRGALVGLVADGDREKVVQISSVMESEADKLAEKILLQIGDSNPQAADLLGVQEFLRKHAS